MKCSIIFLRYVREVGGTSDSIYKPLIVHIVSILSMSTLKMHTKYHIWGTFPAQERADDIP